ncbi:MAG: tRNA pseudouridine(13) synthase TruD [Xanthomonadales bacterium]
MSAVTPDDWAWVLGRPTATGRLRSTPADFQVTELPLVEPSGEGTHLWLQIEKTGANTDWVAAQLARAAGVPRRDVGFAGLKDRNAVTRQWFSIGLQEAQRDDWRDWSIEGVTVLAAHRHARKLQRGALRGNRFRLVVRELRGDAGDLEARLQSIAARGAPNYFGPQRFGHGGRNVARALHWLEHGGRIRKPLRGIYLSALRSLLFNRVLSARVADGTWDRLLDGDIAQLDGSRALFECTLPDETLDRRCADFDIHPTGPLPGRGGKRPLRAAAACEDRILAADRPLVEALERAGLEAARRSLRLRAAELDWRLEEDRLELVFELPAGAYATSLLRELVSTPDEPTLMGSA